MIKEAVIFFCAATCAYAHALHQSTAEAEYNVETKKLEISLTVFVNDLELALIRRSERLMSLEKTPALEFDAEIRAYLADKFVVTDAAGKVSKIEWLGKEVDAVDAKDREPELTMYFEVYLPPGLKGCVLKNNLLDLFPDQINLVRLRVDSRTVLMKMVQGERRKLH